MAAKKGVTRGYYRKVKTKNAGTRTIRVGPKQRTFKQATARRKK